MVLGLLALFGGTFAKIATVFAFLFACVLAVLRVLAAASERRTVLLDKFHLTACPAMKALAALALEESKKALNKNRDMFRQAYARSEPVPPPLPPATGLSVEARLVNLQSLREKNLITEEEYASRRAALLKCI